MKDMEDNVVKYLKYLKVNGSLENPAIDNILRTRTEITGEVIDMVNFQCKSSAEKKATRIEWMAILRKRGRETTKQVRTVALYSKILAVMPYLLVLNQNDGLKELISIFKKE